MADIYIGSETYTNAKASPVFIGCVHDIVVADVDRVAYLPEIFGVVRLVGFKRFTSEEAGLYGGSSNIVKGASFYFHLFGSALKVYGCRCHVLEQTVFEVNATGVLYADAG